MTGDQGVENSSDAEAQPPCASAPISQDAETANTVCRELESHGISCWIAPRDVKSGAQYADAIVRAIKESKALVLVMSASAVGSSHVGKEIERASSKRKPRKHYRLQL
jgi:hypothetical protein